MVKINDALAIYNYLMVNITPNLKDSTLAPATDFLFISITKCGMPFSMKAPYSRCGIESTIDVKVKKNNRGIKEVTIALNAKTLQGSLEDKTLWLSDYIKIVFILIDRLKRFFIVPVDISILIKVNDIAGIRGSLDCTDLLHKLTDKINETNNI